MRDFKYKFNHYIFASEEQFEEARKEYEAIQYINANIENQDARSIYKIYRKLNITPSFRTPVGIQFMNELYHKITTSGDSLLAEIEPVKVLPSVMKATESKQEKVADMGVVEHKEHQRLLVKYKNQRVIIGFLSAFIVIMMYLAFTMSPVANMNTEDTNIDLTDRYSKWEEELKERERAVIEAEKKYQKFTE